MTKHRTHFLAAIFALTLTACGGSSDDTAAPVPPPDAMDEYVFGEWSEWGPPATAAEEVQTVAQTRTRTCEVQVNVRADNPPLNCETQTTTEMRDEPNTAFMDLADTPAFSEWTAWTPETAARSETMVTQTRMRTCTVTVNRAADDTPPTCTGEDNMDYADTEAETQTQTVNNTAYGVDGTAEWLPVSAAKAEQTVMQTCTEATAKMGPTGEAGTCTYAVGGGDAMINDMQTIPNPEYGVDGTAEWDPAQATNTEMNVTQTCTQVDAPQGPRGVAGTCTDAMGNEVAINEMRTIANPAFGDDGTAQWEPATAARSEANIVQTCNQVDAPVGVGSPGTCTYSADNSAGPTSGDANLNQMQTIPNPAYGVDGTAEWTPATAAPSEANVTQTCTVVTPAMGPTGNDGTCTYAVGGTATLTLTQTIANPSYAVDATTHFVQVGTPTAADEFITERCEIDQPARGSGNTPTMCADGTAINATRMTTANPSYAVDATTHFVQVGTPTAADEFITERCEIDETAKGSGNTPTMCADGTAVGSTRMTTANPSYAVDATTHFVQVGTPTAADEFITERCEIDETAKGMGMTPTMCADGTAVGSTRMTTRNTAYIFDNGDSATGVSSNMLNGFAVPSGTVIANPGVNPFFISNTETGTGGTAPVSTHYDTPPSIFTGSGDAAIYQATTIAHLKTAHTDGWTGTGKIVSITQAHEGTVGFIAPGATANTGAPGFPITEVSIANEVSSNLDSFDIPDQGATGIDALDAFAASVTVLVGHKFDTLSNAQAWAIVDGTRSTADGSASGTLINLSRALSPATTGYLSFADIAQLAPDWNDWTPFDLTTASLAQTRTRDCDTFEIGEVDGSDPCDAETRSESRTLTRTEFTAVTPANGADASGFSDPTTQHLPSTASGFDVVGTFGDANSFFISNTGSGTPTATSGASGQRIIVGTDDFDYYDASGTKTVDGDYTDGNLTTGIEGTTRAMIRAAHLDGWTGDGKTIAVRTSTNFQDRINNAALYIAPAVTIATTQPDGNDAVVLSGGGDSVTINPATTVYSNARAAAVTALVGHKFDALTNTQAWEVVKATGSGGAMINLEKALSPVGNLR